MLPDVSAQEKTSASQPAPQTEIEKLNSQSKHLRHIGNYEQSLARAQEAMEKSEKLLGTEHPLWASSLRNLAATYLELGDYTQAEPLLLRALAVKEKVLGPNHREVASIRKDLASLYLDKRDLDRAEHFSEQAVAIYQKLFGNEHRDVANTLNQLAVINRTKRNLARAESLYLQAIEIIRKLYGPEAVELATTLSNLAGVYQSTGDMAKAEALYLKALELGEKRLPPDQADLGRFLYNLGRFYEYQGDDIRSESFYLRSLTMKERAYGVGHPKVAPTLQHLARLYQAKGDIQQALLFQTRSNEAEERDLEQNLISGSERQKMLYIRKTLRNLYQTISLNIQAAPNNPAAQQLALTAVLRHKGRSLDTLTTSIETLRQQQDPQTQTLLDTYAELVEKISSLTLSRGKQPLAEQENLARSLNEQKEKLESEIGQRSKEFQAQFTPITLDRIRQQIPEDAVLVEYAVYQPHNPNTKTFGNQRYAAYVLDRQGTIGMADLGELKSVDQAVTRFRQVLSNPQANFEKEVKPAAQAMEQLVFKPIQALVGKATHVLVSPAGSLCLFPFAALADGKGRFLVERYQLTYLTSGRDLLRLGGKNESRTPPLVVADPDYAEGRGPVLAGKQFSRLARLKGTESEGTALKKIFPQADLKMHREATVEAVKNAQRPEILHIATHGYFLKDTPQSSSKTSERLLVPDESDADEEPEKVKNPLLRAWLFFAGANQSGTKDKSGLLTAMEAAQLNLWGTKLVVLSACETGLGETKDGDGVYGLRRALVLAGSEAQMMSLWSVSDQATQELMVGYYGRLKAGEGRSDALRKVQLEMLKKPKRQHPYFWAAFIQSGEWANLAGKRS